MANVQNLLADAAMHYRSGNYPEAIRVLANAISADASLFESAASQFVSAIPMQDRSQFWKAPSGFYPAGADRKAIFEFIYDRAVWGGGSGAGSDVRFVVPYLAYLQWFIERHAIESILDLGCGDWRFSRLLDFDKRNYLGYDIVQSVVSANTTAFGRPNVRFQQADIVELSEFPSCDLIVCKDVFQHLSNSNVCRVLDKCDHARFLLITNDYHPANIDCEDGETRPLDVRAPPFHLNARPVLNFGLKSAFLVERIDPVQINVEQNH